MPVGLSLRRRAKRNVALKAGKDFTAFRGLEGAVDSPVRYRQARDNRRTSRITDLPVKVSGRRFYQSLL